MRRQDTDTATCRRVPITAAAGGTGWGEASCPHARSILNAHEPIPDPMFPSQTPMFPFPIPLSPSPKPPSQTSVSSPSQTQCPCPDLTPVIPPSSSCTPVFSAPLPHTPVSPVPLTLVADSPDAPALRQEPGAQSGHLPQVCTSANQEQPEHQEPVQGVNCGEGGRGGVKGHSGPLLNPPSKGTPTVRVNSLSSLPL